MKGRKKENPIPIVVVYKKPTGKKFYLRIFIDCSLDDINTLGKRNPLLPDNYTIQEIGIGEGFIEKYKKQFNIKSISSWYL